MQKEKEPTRCVDPVMKYCQGCRYGHNIYPEWVKTTEDLEGICFETVCTRGFDKGRPEDEPTAKELDEFHKWEELLARQRLEAMTPDDLDNLPF